MTEIKTTATISSVAEYLDQIPDENRRSECREIVAMFETVTGQPPVMWGPSIVGFGSYHYKYESGREADMLRVGLSSRKSEIVFYGLANAEENAAWLDKLGKHKVGKGCLYVKKLADIQIDILEQMIRNGYTRAIEFEVK